MSSAPKSRPPVVVVVGHIDHGKSTLLDYIRQTAIVEKEAGGITQRVSAYEVKHRREGGTEEKITFLDTPGHEAFSDLRARSVKIADLAVVIVSAEEGVKAQTVESLAVITADRLPYLIAINKIDRETANLERTKQSLAENNVLVEGYGGTIPCLAISAKTGQGITELLDLVLLMAELAELKSDSHKPAQGFVLEAIRDPRAGIVTTLIIKDGRLESGDWLVVGTIIGRIKKLTDFRGESVAALEASSPAVVLGLPDIPPAGAPFTIERSKGEAEARAVAQAEGKKSPDEEKPGPKTGTSTNNFIVFPLILKADNLGSLEALQKETSKLSTTSVKIIIIHSGLGQITETDVKLGIGAPPATIVGFNVSVERAVAALAEKHELVVKTFEIIYRLSEWLTDQVAQRASVSEVKEETGEIRVLKLFNHEKNRQIIGGTVTKGEVAERERVRITRRDAVLGEGEIIGLKRQQLTVKTVGTGQQFGALVESKIAIAPGDILTVFTREKR